MQTLIETKKKEFDHADFGTIGLESAFGAANTALGLEQAIAALTGLKKRFGIASEGIRIGNIADISLFDPDMNWKVDSAKLLSFSKNSIYHGRQLKGKAYGIISGTKMHLNS